ncbi:cytidine deaminase-like [Planococcus citri]|uniref:cytidine deaminase-like n=1 Tax=Planococcus citri TaxID=170843 RepID=UPI0031F88989
MKVKKFNDLDNETKALLEASIAARDRAYVPFSQFKVGAAILCQDGTTHTGCNIENSAYPMTTCAERTATVKAVSEGHCEFVRLAVCAIKDNDFVSPCGSCRQTVAEFVRKDGNLDIYLVKPDKEDVLETTLKEILPLCFKFD